VNQRPAHRQFPLGPLVAALGALLLIVSLFLDWYDDLTAFTVFEVHDLLLLVLALAVLAALAHRMGLLRPRAAGEALLPAALIALLIVISQILNHPPAADEREKEIGIWLALAGTLLMTVGATLDRTRISLAVETRPRRGPEGDVTAHERAPAAAHERAPAEPGAEPAASRPAGPPPGSTPSSEPGAVPADRSETLPLPPRDEPGAPHRS
jgi:hypothetical protein